MQIHEIDENSLDYRIREKQFTESKIIFSPVHAVLAASENGEKRAFVVQLNMNISALLFIACLIFVLHNSKYMYTIWLIFSAEIFMFLRNLWKWHRRNNVLVFYMPAHALEVYHTSNMCYFVDSTECWKCKCVQWCWGGDKQQSTTRNAENFIYFCSMRAISFKFKP